MTEDDAKVIDRRACKVAGIKPLCGRAHFFMRASEGGMDDGPWATMAFTPVEFATKAAKITRAQGYLPGFGQIDYRPVEYLPVSTDPAASAALCLACLEKGIGEPVAFLSQGASMYAGYVFVERPYPTHQRGRSKRRVPLLDAQRPLLKLVAEIATLPVFATTKERAIAEAVAAAGQTIPED